MYLEHISAISITGTWEGYTATNSQIYNRGAFGSGYSINSFTATGSGTADKSSVTAETAQLKVNLSSSIVHSGSYTGSLRFKSASNSLINYSAYSKLYITFSYAYLDLNTTDREDTKSLSLVALNSSGNTISATTYKSLTGNNTWNQGATEQTISVYVSSYNGVGVFYIELYENYYWRSSSSGGTKNFSHTAYVQRVYLG